jgi:hypothetical protein
MCYLHPEIFIKPAVDSLFSIELERSAAIPSYDDENDLSDLYYKWQLSDTLLLLNEYFRMDEEKIWQLPAMQLTLFVPIGKRIMISKSAGMLFNIVGDTTDIIPEEYFNKVLLMQNTGLRKASQVGK